MRPVRHLLVIALLAALPGLAITQDIQWQVTNPVTPTIVPLYDNQPAPFEHVDPVAAAAANIGPTPEELAAQAALDQAMAKVNGLLSSKAGYQPEVSRLSFGGMLEGPNGRMVALNRRWVGKGTRLKVRVSMSPALSAALSDLRMMSETQAAALQSTAVNQVATQSAVLTITSITDKQVTLSGDGYTRTVPIRQSDN